MCICFLVSVAMKNNFTLTSDLFVDNHMVNLYHWNTVSYSFTPQIVCGNQLKMFQDEQTNCCYEWKLSCSRYTFKIVNH